MRLLIFGGFTLVVLMIALRLLVPLVEPRLAFFPSPGDSATPADAGLPFEALTLDTADGERLRAWWVPHPRPRATVVYFHGNGGNLSVWLPVVERLHRRGFAVFMGDYRGYGLSSGTPSEAGLYKDVDAMLARVAALAPPRPVIFWGRSLGTVMAAYGATRVRPDGLVLEAGFPDAASVSATMGPVGWLARFGSLRLPAAEFAARVDVPALVLHGTADSVIPFALGQRLHAALPRGTPFLAIEGGDHNDLDPPDPAAYWAAVDELVLRLSQASPPEAALPPEPGPAPAAPPSPAMP
jgi:pimeloyl-ACP methyl ester carboxylesterase